MPMYRSEVEARRLDFDYPELVADIENWCNGKRVGRKLLVDWEGRGNIARQGWYVVRIDDDFTAVESGVFDLLFPEQLPPDGATTTELDAWEIRRWCKAAGITGSDLTSAMNAWRKDPSSADGSKVQSVIEANRA